MTVSHATRPAFYHYLPFAVFMAFIGLDEFIRFLAGQGLFTLEATTLYYLYPAPVSWQESSIICFFTEPAASPTAYCLTQ
jgi:hypothetical protein